MNPQREKANTETELGRVELKRAMRKMQNIGGRSAGRRASGYIE